MKLVRCLGCLLLLAGLAFVASGLPVFAQEKGVELKWKAFDKDTKPFYQTMSVDTNQKMTVMGMSVEQVQKQTFYALWTPQTKEKDKWVVGMKIVGADMDINIGGNKISYRSWEEQQQNPLTEFFNALLKLDLKFTIDPKDMKVEKIEGNDVLITSLAKSNPQMEGLLRSILSEDALKRMAEPPLYAVPTKAVKKGGAWKRDSDLNLGPIGKYKTDYAFEYVGKYSGKDSKKKDLDEIKVKATLTYVPPMEKGTKLPFVIESDSKLSGDGTGTVFFNAAKGRIEEYSLTMNLKGDLNIDIGGMKTKVSLTQDQTSKVITSDTDPTAELKSKKKKS